MPMPALNVSEGSKLANALQQLGARRVEAALVASLARGEPMGTSDIVAATGLRQPEVSVGMQELRDRHWVAFEAVPRQGKGRPMHRYRLIAQRDLIRQYYEAQARAMMTTFEKALSVVKQTLG